MTDTHRSYTMTIAPLNRCIQVSPDSTLLQSAREAGIRLPNSCRNGTCRACLCRLSEGSITYRIEWPGVSREEKAEGWVLPCVAYPTSDLVLEAPAARPCEPGT
jgi:ferredoxin